MTLTTQPIRFDTIRTDTIGSFQDRKDVYRSLHSAQFLPLHPSTIFTCQTCTHGQRSRQPAAQEGETIQRHRVRIHAASGLRSATGEHFRHRHPCDLPPARTSRRPSHDALFMTRRSALSTWAASPSQTNPTSCCCWGRRPTRCTRPGGSTSPARPISSSTSTPVQSVLTLRQNAADHRCLQTCRTHADCTS